MSPVGFYIENMNREMTVVWKISNEVWLDDAFIMYLDGQLIFLLVLTC